MIYFLQITIQSKATDDFRAFLDWADRDTMTVYQLRGYGATPVQATEDAWLKYNSPDRDLHIQDSWEWK